MSHNKANRVPTRVLALSLLGQRGDELVLDWELGPQSTTPELDMDTLATAEDAVDAADAGQRPRGALGAAVASVFKILQMRAGTRSVS